MLFPAMDARTLLDAAIFHSDNTQQDAIIFVATDEVPKHVTRSKLQTNVRRYGSALKEQGIQPGDLIIIAHTQNLESIYAFWGALSIGAIPSMFPTLTEKLDPVIYRRNMAKLVQRSQVRAILTSDDFAPQLAPHVPCPVIFSQQLNLATEVTTVPLYTPEPKATAFLQHSSGTTGLQKGVALSHTAVLRQITSYSQAIALQPNDVVVSWLPLYHDMGLIAGFLLPLVQGIPLILMSPFDWVRHPSLLLRAIHDYQGTLCWLPNFAYNHSARRVRRRDSDGLDLSTMRLFVNCSEPVRHDSHQLFLERFGENGVCNDMLGVSYAMAENTFAVTQTLTSKPPQQDVVDREQLEKAKKAQPVPVDHPRAVAQLSCGYPIAGTDVQILNKQGVPLPDRHVGEIAIRSNYMLSGYYRRPDLQVTQKGWLWTGDLGYLVDNELFVLGRSDDLIIHGGKNIYPHDIEAIVNDVPGVRAGRAVVFGVPDLREGTEVIAVVAEITPSNNAARKIISKTIRQAVARQTMVNVGYVSLVDDKWLIKTSSGKIARNANRTKWLKQKKLL